MPARADEFALSYCGRCDEVTKHRVTSIIEVRPNLARTANGRCWCGARKVVGLPPTPEDMAAKRKRWAGKEPDDDIPME